MGTANCKYYQNTIRSLLLRKESSMQGYWEVLLTIYFGCFLGVVNSMWCFTQKEKSWGKRNLFTIWLFEKQIVRSICKDHFWAWFAPLFKSFNISTLPFLYIWEAGLTVNKAPNYLLEIKKFTKLTQDTEIGYMFCK